MSCFQERPASSGWEGPHYNDQGPPWPSRTAKQRADLTCSLPQIRVIAPYRRVQNQPPNLGAGERPDREAGRAVLGGRLVSSEQQAHGDRLYVQTRLKKNRERKKVEKGTQKTVTFFSHLSITPHTLFYLSFFKPTCPPAWAWELERRATLIYCLNILLALPSLAGAQRHGRQPYKPCLPMRDPIPARVTPKPAPFSTDSDCDRAPPPPLMMRPTCLERQGRVLGA